MTARTWNAMLCRSALAGLAAISLFACGSREPTTDAERLARGRELVQKMSTRLAAANAMSVTTSEVRDVVRAVRQESDGVANGLVYRATPRSFLREDDG